MRTKLASITLLLIAILIACGPKPNFYNYQKLDFQPFKTVAILPFNNFSGQEDAGKQVSNAFLVELLKKPYFRVIEPGQVDLTMRRERIRSADQIDVKTAQLLRDSLHADYILIGAVNEYSYIKSGEKEVPLVGFTVRLLDTSNGTIVWAANHSRKGDDRELVFSWGLITSLTRLTQKSVKEVAQKL